MMKAKVSLCRHAKTIKQPNYAHWCLLYMGSTKYKCDLNTLFSSTYVLTFLWVLTLGMH